MCFISEYLFMLPLEMQLLWFFVYCHPSCLPIRNSDTYFIIGKHRLNEFQRLNIQTKACLLPVFFGYKTMTSLANISIKDHQSMQSVYVFHSWHLSFENLILAS